MRERCHDRNLPCNTEKVWVSRIGRKTTTDLSHRDTKEEIEKANSDINDKREEIPGKRIEEFTLAQLLLMKEDV